MIDTPVAPVAVTKSATYRRGERVRTPEPIGAIPAGTTGTIVEVRSLHLRDGALVRDDSTKALRYTVGWDLKPRRWTSELAASTLEYA